MIKLLRSLLRSFVCLIQTLSVAFVLLVGAGALASSATVSDPLSSMDFWSLDGSALDSDTQRYMSHKLGEYIATAAGAIGGGVGAGKVGFKPKPGSSDEASVKPDVETSGNGNNSPPVGGGSLGKPDYDLPNGYSQRPDGSVVNDVTGAVYTPTGKYTQDGKPIFNTESAGTTSQTTLTNPATSNSTINLGAPKPNQQQAKIPEETKGAIGFSNDTVGTAFAGMREGHAIRHLQGDIIPNTASLQSRVDAFKEVATPILTNPTKTAPWRVGATNGRAFLGSSNGKNVVVVVATDGPKQGKVITSFIPDSNQLSIINSR